MRPANTYEETVPAFQEVPGHSCPHCGGALKDENRSCLCVVCGFRLCRGCVGGIPPAD
jgi:hypothetical protein